MTGKKEQRIRALQAQGHSRASAHNALRSEKISMKNARSLIRFAAQRIIARAKALRDEQRTHDAIHLDDTTDMKALFTRTPAETKLIEALDELPDDAIRKLEVLYYAARAKQDGSGDADIKRTHRTLLHDERDVTIANLVGKMPLAELLTEGLKLADKQNVDLDAAW